ncbi:hypothetical protein R3P38DRAFT_2820891 [Favolaschia claudopus]|uniref:RRM domain-containing protein n=1 Tax=Favolaschia claudopus TaxID=2862362 RepID=A0AAW0EH06_9AGAR
MNRHHPYGGGGGSFEMRRGGPPGGPGPDRPQRFTAYNNRGRGFSRGRGGGGYGGNAPYDGNMSNGGAYDQGPPSEPSMAPYNNYDAPSQDSYYQNNYGAGAGPQYPGSPSQSGYDQGYGNDSNEGSNYDDRRRPAVRKGDDKVHDSIIEERIQRERPCRTLFIRNIKYETDSQDVRSIFEEHGEIKTFFDLISTRGMVFVTYYDLRAAERARDRLQGSEISGRPIDVHYSLPRDDHAKGGDRDKNQQLQGCLQVTLRNSQSGQHINDNEVRHKFQQFGDVKSVKPVGDRPDSRYVEFYDTRACDEAYDRLRHQGLQDGVMDIIFAWDVNEGNGPSGQNQNHHGDDRFHNTRGARGGNRGNRGRGGGRGGRGWSDDHHGGRDRRRFDDDYSNQSYRNNGPSPGGRPYNNNQGYDGRGPAPYNGGYDGQMNPPGPPPSNYGPPPPAPPPQVAPQPTNEERLEQARKVQALLAALKPPENGGPPTSAPAPPPMPMQPPYPGFGPPPPGAMPPLPSFATSLGNPYGMPPPPAAPSQAQPGGPPPQNPAAMGALPPHILALLQQAQQQQQGTAPSPYNMPGMPPGGMPAPLMMNTPPPGANPQQYQQLLYHLRAQAGASPQK